MIDQSAASLPCFYFPTKVVMVDDDEIFLEALSFYLKMTNQTFNNSVHALEKLLSYQPQISENLWLKTDPTTDPTDRIHEQSLLINLDGIKHILSNNNRYDDISVLIIDYKMPDKNGIDMLERLKNKPFKKLLLTGEGDNQLAVKAFNENLIDHFISKTEHNLLEKIHKAALKLKVEYFLSFTGKLKNYSTHISNITSNNKLKLYFFEIIKKYNIVEFYLTDFSGTFFFLDKNHNIYYFIVYSDEQINNLANVAEQDEAPKEVIEQIKLCSKIPFFGKNNNYWEVPGEKWSEYLHPIDTIIELDNGNLYTLVVKHV